MVFKHGEYFIGVSILVPCIRQAIIIEITGLAAGWAGLANCQHSICFMESVLRVGGHPA